MKRRTYGILLGCEAALCVLLYLTRGTLPQYFTSLLAFPFEQIGMLLRAWSLSGTAGNVAAIALYALLSLCPMLLRLLLPRRDRRLYPEDALLIVLSALLFAVLYVMVNPSLLGALRASELGQSVCKALLGGITYSVILGYLVLRMVRSFSHAETGRLQAYLSALLSVLNAVFVYLAFGSCFGELLDAVAKLRAGNVGNEAALGASYVFLGLQYALQALPYIWDVLVVFALQELLRQRAMDRYSQTAVQAADRLARRCVTALAVTVLSQIVFNLLQLLCIRWLYVVNGTVSLPLLSIGVALTALLLARYSRENKQLKDDNDMFI